MKSSQLDELGRGLVDPDKADGFLRALVQKYAGDETPGASADAAVRVTNQHAEMIALSNLRLAFAAAESEIEKLFLSAVVFVSAALAPFRIIFTPRFANATEALSTFRQNLERSDELFSVYQSLSGESGLLGFCEALSAMHEIGELDFADMMTIKANQMFYRHFGLSTAFHLSPQASLREIRVGKRSIRPDLFVWVPDRPGFKLVVECDGYQFHSNREAFTADRLRDRTLKSKGIDVFRFSGSEINRNPVAVASELVNFLIEADLPAES